MADDIIQQAQKRFEETSKIIAEAEKVRAEHNQLAQFLEIAKQLSTTLPGNGHKLMEEPDVQIPATQPPNMSIPDRAYAILKAKGKLHLTDLFTEMRRLGWKSTGDDVKDKKNLNTSLSTRPTRFHNLGKNVWEVVG
jgi:hypothetical protein